jgi:predicted nuclease with RNAse H fold
VPQYETRDNVAVDTCGINLAAPRSNRWLAVIRWEDEKAELLELAQDFKDYPVAGVISGFDIVGINCPFAWPRSFAECVTNYAAKKMGGWSTGVESTGPQLNYRLTDEIVKHIVPGVRLPSAISGKTALATLQCAQAVADLGYPPSSFGGEVDPGSVVEVCPPASLSQWGMPYKGYKTAKGRSLLDAMATKLVKYYPGPWLRLGRWFDTCRTDPDAFEAVIAALTARAVAVGRAIKPRSVIELEYAATEGWIWIPDKGSLPGLCSTPAEGGQASWVARRRQ